MNFATEMLLGMINDILTDLYSKIGLFVTEIYTYAVEVNQIEAVVFVSGFTMLLGIFLCGLTVVKQVIGTYGIGTEGDPDQDPIEIVFRLCKALGMIGANSFLFTELMKFSNAVSKDVAIATASASNNLYDSIMNLLSGAGSSSSPTVSIFSSVTVISFTLFAISACLRGAELTLNRIILPIFALDILNSNPEKWKMFIFQYGIGFFSYILQMLCFNIFTIQFCGMDVNNLDFKQFFVLLGWLVLSIKTPHLLEKYIYATGTGKAISNGASRLGQVIMYAGMRI